MHYTFTLQPPITPKPPDGYTYGEPDANGCVATWARTEMYAQLAVFAAQGHHQKQYADYFRKTVLDANPVEQVDGVQNLYTLDATQSAALQHGIANTRYIQVGHMPMPALDANNNPVVGAQAWQGPNAQGVANINLNNLLPSGYAYAFQYNLNKGADGTQTGTGTMTGA